MKFTTATTTAFLLSAIFLADQATAATHVLDFSEFSAGDWVRGLGRGTTVTVSPLPGSSGEGGCFTGGKHGNAPMIFDSSNPSGGDDDLGSPNKDFGGPGKGLGGKRGTPGANSVGLDNLLIISEDCDTNDPDDSVEGGVFTFTFRTPKPLKSIGLFDFEDGGYISAKLSNGSVYQSAFIEGVGNNGFQDVELNLFNVVELSVTCLKSGAIPYLAFQKVDFVGAYGDPHFKTWDGAVYEYQGECDLVLLDNPKFDNGDGMTIHLRTNIKGKFSVIQNAVLAIGDETFEIAAGGPKTWSNGAKNHGAPSTIGKYEIMYWNENMSRGMMHVFKVDLGGDDSLIFKSFDDMVDVRIRSLENRVSRFGGSLGMVGALETGAWVGRDGATEFDDEIAFASEWQVKSSDPDLFHQREGPQYPRSCVLPDKKRRQLLRGEEGNYASQKVSSREAQMACSNGATLSDDEYDACVSDVLSVGDLALASHYV